MRKPMIEAEYECPHCGAEYEMQDDAIYTDHVTDEYALQCEDCGEWYQLQCESVEVHLAATKAPESVIPNRPPSLPQQKQPRPHA